MIKKITWVLLLVFLTGACQANIPAPEASPSPSAVAPVLAASTPTPRPSPSPVPPTATMVPSPTARPTMPPEGYGPDDFPEDINPLTGLPASDPDLLDRRPVSVKVQTFPRGQRPAFGISLADIVFDYYQNNGLTRLHAVFYGNNAERVSPIRSARLLDGSLVEMYKSIFAFGGADQRILNQMYQASYADRLVVEKSGNCPPICRVDPNGFNYLIADTEALSKAALTNGVTNERQNLEGMLFRDAPPEGGQPGEQAFVRYSISAYTRWDYDPGSGRYLRFQDTQEDTGQGEEYAPFIDGLTEEQVAADNVVVLLAAHEYAFKKGQSEIVEIQLNGTGKAYAFRDGQAYELVWNRPAADSVLNLTWPDGSPFAFKPGTTWFQVVGQSAAVVRADGAENPAWRFTFSFP